MRFSKSLVLCFLGLLAQRADGRLVYYETTNVPIGRVLTNLDSALEGLQERGDALVTRLWNGLRAIRGVRCYGPPPGRPRSPTVSFIVEGVASSEVARVLAQKGVFVSHGSFYATTVVEALGHTREGLVGAGCAAYTTDDEIERLIRGVEQIVGRRKA